MTDQKLTELDELTAVDPADLVYIVDDPAGTPTAKKATVANVYLGGMADVGVRAYHNADQTITNTTNTTVAFNSEEYDTHSFHDLSTNNSRMTIPSGMGGKYILGFSCVTGAMAANTYFQAKFLLDGTTTIGQNKETVGATEGSNGVVMSFSIIKELLAGSYVEVVVYHASGGDETLHYYSAFTPFFWIQKVG